MSLTCTRRIRRRCALLPATSRTELFELNIYRTFNLLMLINFERGYRYNNTIDGLNSKIYNVDQHECLTITRWAWPGVYWPMADYCYRFAYISHICIGTRRRKTFENCRLYVSIRAVQIIWNQMFRVVKWYGAVVRINNSNNKNVNNNNCRVGCCCVTDHRRRRRKISRNRIDGRATQTRLT